LAPPPLSPGLAPAPSKGLTGRLRPLRHATAVAEKELDDDARMIASIGLAYDADRIEAYFAERPEELSEHSTSVASTLLRLAIPVAAGALATWARLNSVGRASKDDSLAAAWSSWRSDVAPRLADALFELGPTYVKFGQSLASRPDIVSAEIAAELVRLQDALPPFDEAVAREILGSELSGRGPAAEELLASLEGAEPVAAASLGQVYKGRVGGRDVAVKVQRPDVRRTAAADAAQLKAFARYVASLQVPNVGYTGDDLFVPLVRADLLGAVDEFCSRLFEEMDYSREAANIRRFASLYGKQGEHAARIPPPGVRVPELLHELCTRRVLVMEWIDGERLVPAETDGSSPRPVAKGDLPLVEIGIAATLLQLLETGVMHTDPHGGNLLKAPWQPPPPAEGEVEEHHVVQDPALKQLVYLDFGLIADVPLQVRDGLVCAVMYIVRKRWDRVASLFNQLMLLPDWVLEDPRTLERFTADIEAAARVALDFDGAGPEGVPSLRFSALLEQLALLAPRYEFRLPPYFLNNARAIGCLEGMARSADPDFNIMRRMYPFAIRRLLANPGGSPVLRRTLRDLARDERTGRLSRRTALELVDAAAALQGATRQEVLRDFLRAPGGRRFAAEVLTGECLAVTERALDRGFSFLDHWASRARKAVAPKVTGLEEWEKEEQSF